MIDEILFHFSFQITDIFGVKMLGNWQASLLITDEPSNFENQHGQLYVLHTQPDGSIRGYCVSRPFYWKGTEEWARRSQVCERFYDVSFVSGDNKDPLISYGGGTDDDTAFLIHDASDCWSGDQIVYESSKTISDNILCVAKLEDALDHVVKTKIWPKYGTIVVGYSKFTNEEVSANVASGKWQSRSLLPYPFVVFADDMRNKVEVSKAVLREYDGNTFSLMGHMLAILDEAKIAGVKYVAWKKLDQDTAPDEMEKIIRLMLYLELSKEDKFFDLEHGDWQEKLAEFRKTNIGGTEFDGLKRTPIMERYEELEGAYKKLGFDPRMMELGLMLKMGGNKAKPNDKAPPPANDKDPTKWGQTVEMLKAVVKGRASDPD